MDNRRADYNLYTDRCRLKDCVRRRAGLLLRLLPCLPALCFSLSLRSSLVLCALWRRRPTASARRRLARRPIGTAHRAPHRAPMIGPMHPPHRTAHGLTPHARPRLARPRLCTLSAPCQHPARCRPPATTGAAPCISDPPDPDTTARPSRFASPPRLRGWQRDWPRQRQRGRRRNARWPRARRRRPATAAATGQREAPPRAKARGGSRRPRGRTLQGGRGGGREGRRGGWVRIWGDGEVWEGSDEGEERPMVGGW